MMTSQVIKIGNTYSNGGETFCFDSAGAGVVVDKIRITPDIIKDQFRSAGLSVKHIWSLFNPEDQQDVKLAFNMLRDVWSLPRLSTNSR